MTTRPDRPRHGRSDAHPLNWLLAVPLLLVLVPPLYNRESPKLGGVPFFYWWQLVAIPISVACTLVVYRATRHRGGDR